MRKRVQRFGLRDLMNKAAISENVEEVGLISAHRYPLLGMTVADLICAPNKSGRLSRRMLEPPLAAVAALV
jgi:hypothetical protein